MDADSPTNIHMVKLYEHKLLMKINFLLLQTVDHRLLNDM